MVLQLIGRWWWVTVTPAFIALGYYLDKRSDNNYSRFKNKSVLYRRELQPGEKDPWT
ncbi:NADH dehydrogenase [ubiquinone] 1 beta subcomplex subunit 1 [Saccoglossus kowalevskii]|uniref:NADH dehydrogenase [ubiquinone] 1 beta subcomplex subunit 1 n=1 Tax=Saccoglossus kowalevskii TaxID=10224 RepID=A0ABM0GGZ6_SACKO|nr:NADH dehydrogenase [ubiquinone] 1 beta subcomplex subunit 1 [Saccoglossus kowalevskii]